ncbi:hypothetical protein D3OALGA1CA_801 [Olavius algarvensis associated proteobacterium Delta 3]|nr:hypothetical protein D3OALGA1CA_801 [Olavius algarvensis associated proteobacterium Delta 3]CAB5142382.1 hypothetical protein D3OALGB2SA_4305 [Olavius algarvensis associated proteobacterium Delta 3]
MINRQMTSVPIDLDCLQHIPTIAPEPSFPYASNPEFSRLR